MRDGPRIIRTSSARTEDKKGFVGKDPYLERLERNDCRLPTNPHHIESREAGLKDTWTMFYKNSCCSNGSMHDGRRLRDQSSGNFPKYFGYRIAEVTGAMEQELRGTGAYMAGIERAREAVASCYRVPPDHVFFSDGISGGIEMLHQVFLHNTSGRVLIPNVSYPTHFSTAVNFGGRNLIETVPRHPETGIPDFSGCTNGGNPFLRVGFSSFIPWDNPLPVVYPESFYRNGQGTGIFDLNEAAFAADGVIRPVVLDVIYKSFSWERERITYDRILELGGERNIIIFLNSLSKVFMEPNKRAGVIAVYVPPALIRYAEGNLIRDLQSIFDRKLCGISNVSAAGLAAAHAILERDERGRDAQLETIRMDARTRFIGADGLGGNQGVMRSLPYVRPLYPAISIESSGYNMFYIDHPDPPWMRPDFKRSVLARLESVIEGLPDKGKAERYLSALRDYLKSIPPERMAASDIFCLDLVLETGVAFAPAERFYKLGTAPEQVAFRPVMVGDPAGFLEDAKLVETFLLSRLS